MRKPVLPVVLLALSGCAAERGVPLTNGAERPAWLLDQPPRYERHPLPDGLGDTLALRRTEAPCPPPQGRGAPGCEPRGGVS
jgi:hypothetical protein